MGKSLPIPHSGKAHMTYRITALVFLVLTASLGGCGGGRDEDDTGASSSAAQTSLSAGTANGKDLAGQESR
jgi:hypothetical protein